MKIFSKALKDQAIKIINYEKKEMYHQLTKKKRHMKIKKFAKYVNKNFARMKIIKKNFN